MTRFPSFPKTSALLVTLAFPSTSSAAEGLRNLPSSAQAQGMTGGSIALTNDPSVVRLNPASMLDLDRTTTQFTVAGYYGRTDYESSTGRKNSLNSELIPVPSFNTVWRPDADSRWAFGFGVNAPYGLSGKWPRQGTFQFLAPYEEELAFISLNPAVAFQATDSLSIGFGLEVVYSTLTLSQDYPWGLVTGSAATPAGGSDFDADGWGLGAYLGANWEPAEGHRLSLTARIPMSINYSGDFEIDNVPAPLSGAFSESSEFKTDLEYPGSIALAYRYEVNDRLRIGLQYEWIQNSTHDDIPINVGSNQALFTGAESIVLDWKDSFSAGIGVEWDVNDRLTLRGGYYFSESPISNETFTPAVALSDRNLLSVGATYRFSPDCQLSLSYINSIFDDRNFQNNQQPGFNGNYEINWQAVTTSFTYAF